MSAKSPPLTPEQIAFHTAVVSGLEIGTCVGFGRTESGQYQAPFVREAWKLWQAARAYERENCAICRQGIAGLLR